MSRCKALEGKSNWKLSAWSGLEWSGDRSAGGLEMRGLPLNSGRKMVCVIQLCTLTILNGTWSLWKKNWSVHEFIPKSNLWSQWPLIICRLFAPAQVQTTNPGNFLDLSLDIVMMSVQGPLGWYEKYTGFTGSTWSTCMHMIAVNGLPGSCGVLGVSGCRWLRSFRIW